MSRSQPNITNYIDIAMFQQGPVVVFRWHNEAHWPVEFVTANVVDLLGYTDEDFLQGRVHFDAIVHADDLQRVAQEVQFHNEAGAERFQHADYRLIAKDGSLRWVEDHTQIVRDDEGVVTHYVGYVLDVTARKEVEQALVRAEERLAKSTRFANIGIWDWNIVSGDLHWSERIAPLFGYAAGSLETSYENFLNAVHCDDRQLVIDAVNACVEQGAEYDIEHRVVWPDGSVHWIHERGDVIRSEDGTPQHMLGVVQDITERKNTEYALQRFRVALDTSADAIYLIDREAMKFVDANRVGWESLGYQRDELLCLGPHDIKPTFDRGTLALEFDQLAKSDENIGVIETTHQRRDGSVFPVEIFVSHFSSAGRNMIVAVVRDRSELRQTEKRLRESEARFKGIAESMSDWIWELDAEGRFTFCSGRVEDILGYKPEELAGRTPFDLILPIDVERVSLAFAKAREEKAPISNLENWNLAKDGTPICLSTSGIPLLDEAGNLLGFRGVDTDISERKHAEEALVQAKVEAETASQAKSEFLSRMSHELRTPMNAILGFTEILLGEYDDDKLSDDQRDSLQMIFQAGHHLLDLINEVLDLSKIEAGKLVLSLDNVSWREILKQCLELTQPAAEKASVRLFDQATATALPERVRADHMRLRQVLLNLLSNAVKYNRRDGSVTVTAQMVLKDRLRISVHDTGQGLDAKQLAKLFQPFNRLEAEGSRLEGVGIGLVISKRLMELMDGKIFVESRPGEGSVFSLELNTAEE